MARIQNNMLLRKEIGRRFTQLRDARKLTIAQVARESKISRDTIKGIEQGTTEWLITTMINLCRYYNQLPSEFLKGL
jgi:transcriptional regulator with XRE-family HTH domain